MNVIGSLPGIQFQRYLHLSTLHFGSNLIEHEFPVFNDRG